MTVSMLILGVFFDKMKKAEHKKLIVM